MFASFQPSTARQYVSICATDVGASRNVTSAPASRNRRHRSRASSKPRQAFASVRAMTTSPPPCSSRASQAARTRATASARGTTALTPVWPQRFGETWSSIITPAAPTCA